MKEMSIMSFWDLPFLERARLVQEACERSMVVRIALCLFLFLFGLMSIIAGIANIFDGGRLFLILFGLFLWVVVAIDIFINIRKNRFYW